MSLLQNKKADKFKLTLFLQNNLLIIAHIVKEYAKKSKLVLSTIIRRLSTTKNNIYIYLDAPILFMIKNPI